MGGRVLAINEGSGYRPILSVTSVVYIPQQDARSPSTVVYGNNMVNIPENYGVFRTFFVDKVLTSMLWAQLRISEQVLEAEMDDVEWTLWPRLPVVKIMQERLVMLGAGKDDLRGYYVQFQGGPIRLFSQPDWWKENYDEEYCN